MRPRTTEPDSAVHRTRLDLDDAPLDVLRRFRGRDRLVALLGDWHHGEALIAFDPVRVLTGDPFDVDLPDAVETASGGFGGGWIGAWGYAPGYHRVAFYDHVLRRSDGTWWLESLTVDADRDARVLRALAAPAPPARPFRVDEFASVPAPERHREQVGRVLDHVAAGDVFQVNLCLRLESRFSGDSLDAFCAGVERLRPAYGAFVSAPEGTLLSFSPELFLRRTGDEVLTSPIKGTAPLSSDPAELVASAKDRAENVMIVDLMRNDLGRVCVPGSVRVPAMVRAERHAVWHLVSDVVGHLAHDVTDRDLLAATFPPGSVTGAPKIRAMEIIDDLEATTREAYTGAIGHVSPAAGLEMNVVIRTFEVTGDRIHLGVGGGVVADSTPDGELAEVLVKARPLVEAIGGRLLDAAVRPEPTRESRPAGPPRDDRGIYDTVPAGIYDTVLVVDGVAVDLDAHLARLDASVRAVHGTTVRAGLDDAVARRVRGSAGRHRLRLDAVPSGGDVSVSMAMRPIDDDVESWRLRSLVVDGGLGEHKWTDRSVLPATLPSDEDTLLVDVDGSLLETGRASLFLVMDDGVHTPALDGRILPGTTRARVIELLREADVPVFQHRLTRADLDTAAEVFVTNALRGVVPVSEIDGRPLVAGPTTSRTRTALLNRWSGQPSADSSTPRAMVDGARVLFVDNYDSFVYNLVQYVGELGASCEVVRNDAVTVDELVRARAAGDVTHVVISPGPGSPAEAGISVETVRRLGPTTPVLGVCLGHQAIAEAYGAAVVRAPEIVHGKPSLMHHDGLGVHRGLPSPLTVARYHSLVVDERSLPPDLQVTGRTASGVVMGLRHRSHPVEGVQWHPESILTARGHDVLATFLA